MLRFHTNGFKHVVLYFGVIFRYDTMSYAKISAKQYGILTHLIKQANTYLNDQYINGILLNKQSLPLFSDIWIQYKNVHDFN